MEKSKKIYLLICFGIALLVIGIVSILYCYDYFSEKSENTEDSDDSAYELPNAIVNPFPVTNCEYMIILSS